MTDIPVRWFHLAMSYYVLLAVVALVSCVLTHRCIANFWLATIAATALSLPSSFLLYASIYTWYPDYWLFLPVTAALATGVAAPIIIAAGWAIRRVAKAVNHPASGG